MRNSSILSLALICLGSFFLPLVMALRSTVEAAQAVGLMPRAEVCGGASGLSQCGNNFPSSFCCPSGTTCFGFNNNQGVICCPGNSCAVTNALSCDIQVYNATANPTSPMHLANLNAQLTTCGTNTCCPPGYSCNGNECVLASLLTSLTTGVSTAKATPAPTPTAVTISAASKPTGAATPIPVTSGTPPSATVSPSTTNQFPIQAVLVGLFPGLIGGCLLALLFVLCLKGRRKAKQNVDDDDTSSLGPTAAKVSDPIYSDLATRTDFLRYAPRNSHRDGGSGPSTPMSRVRSLFSKGTPSLGPQRFRDQSSPRGPGELSTPPRQINREPSMASIKMVYTPPPDLRVERQTTFGDLLKNVGSQPAPPMPVFMGSPGMVDPRSRGVDAGNLK